MKRTILNVALLVATAAALLAPVILRRDPTKPNVSFPIREMVDSIPYNAYSPNPILPGGRTLQPPVAGSIAHGEIPLHYASTPEDALRAGEELTNPFAGAAATTPTNDELGSPLERGAEYYRIFCQHCHGATGAGDGPVAQRGFPPPPNFKGENAMKMKDGQIFHIITHGQNNMPPHGSQITPEERWMIVLHVRSLQGKTPGAAEPPPPPPPPAATPPAAAEKPAETPAPAEAPAADQPAEPTPGAES